MKTFGAPRFHRNLFLAALFAAILNFIAFYPGLFHHDAWAYFDSARTGDFTNWQPPLLGKLWIPLQAIWYGPQPMLVLFVAGYWSGFVLLALAYEAERQTLAAWVFAAGLFPLALNFNGVLVKDTGMAVCLLLATGIAAALMRGAIKKRAATISAMWLFLVMGAFMRANALFALPPLLDLAGIASSIAWAKTGWIKRTIAVFVIALAFAPAHILADRHIFRVHDIYPMSQLQIFDIGGITYFSGVDRFQGFFGPDFVARNHNCYRPEHWDSYGWDVCEEVYENLKPQFGEPLTKMWLAALSADPLSYLTHRIAHFNRFLQIVCRDCKAIVFTGMQSQNQNEFTFTPTFLYAAIDWASEAINDSPFGRPYVWLLICLAWSISSLAIPDPITRRITFMIAASGALYTSAYAVVGIASDFRYIYWTLLCALVTTPAIVARVIARHDANNWLRFGPLGGILALIVLREFALRALS
ncbi:MAG TPA: hypothetical protein VKT73_09115 [Xanthobacteraceae bacterium]|nr:hypothetical protein [Xanthobacteraceae bacterium]